MRALDDTIRGFAAPAVAELLREYPEWRLYAGIETFGTVVAVVLGLVTAFLLFAKHRRFPAAFLVFNATSIALAGARIYFSQTLPGTIPGGPANSVAPLALGLGIKAAWIAYLFGSRRVRLTFTRRFYFSPAFPFFLMA